MKSWLKKLLIVLGAAVLLLVLFVGGVILYSATYSIPEQAASIENATGLVQAHGRSLYDAAGNRLALKGINAGQILLQEGWMSPFALEPSKNPDGSYAADKDGNLQYPEFTEEEFRSGLKANPNLADYDLEALLAYYYSCFFTEADFRIIREELGLNTIRLPFYYLNILNEDLTLKEEADALLYRIAQEDAALISKRETIEKKEKPPLLYDLTCLQRDANKMMGFTAQQTLDYAQNLYEKKLITYPRTNSRYLTEDMEKNLRDLIPAMAEKFGYIRNLPIHTGQVINNKKVSDHHAIIPTKNVAHADFGELPSGEVKILSLIVTRLLAGVGDSYNYEETVLEVTAGGAVFKAKGKREKRKGFKDLEFWIFGKGNEEEEEDSVMAFLEDLREGRKYPLRDPYIKEGKTTPKKRFTEDSLLAAMERAGAEDKIEQIEFKGIGTPATRAGIIEKLVRVGFVERQGEKKTKQLVPTHKGISLITIVPEAIQSPTMTAEWEEKLISIEAKEYEAEQFMREIIEMIFILIRDYRVIDEADVLMRPAVRNVGVCPCCGGNVVEKTKGFFCNNHECRFVLWKEHAFFSVLGKKVTGAVAKNLLAEGRVDLTGCCSAKTGKSYNATVLMTLDGTQKPQFSLSFERGEG